MVPSRRAFAISLGIMPALSITGRPVEAAFPNHPVTLVVPFAAGGASDTLARVLADRLGSLLAPGGISLVENRPGAGGGLAADHVRRSKPDGHTLLVGTVSNLAVGPVTQPGTIRYQPTEDFDPLALLGLGALGLVVAASSDARTPQELARRLREQPGRFAYASGGVGAISHLAGELFANMAGVAALHVPYRGGSSLAEAVLKGEVEYAIDPLGSVAGAIRGGAVRLLAVTTAARDPVYPDVPTLKEAGMPEYELSNWAALVGPRGLPQEVARTLNSAANTALSEPTARLRLQSAGFGAIFNSTQVSTRAFISAELDRYRSVISRIGLQVT